MRCAVSSPRLVAQTQQRMIALLAVVLLLVVEPALANKFETIGGGFSGSSGIKREWLVKFFTVAGGMSLLAAFLAVFVPHKNSLFLNFSNWKQSAIILSILAAGFFLVAAIL